jgi:hypothetical protein
VKHFNVTYVKQHPVMFGAIFLVFGLFLWMLLNRGASSASATGTTVVTPGPSDAMVAANTQLQLAQIEGQTNLGMAQLSLAANAQNNDTQESLAAMALQAQFAQIQADHDLSNAQIEASLGALTLQLGNNLAITHDNNQFMIDYAKNAQDSATAQLLIGANLQERLGAQQLKAFQTSAILSVVPTLKKGDRDNALISIALGAPSSHGSVTGPGTGGLLETIQ